MIGSLALGAMLIMPRVVSAGGDAEAGKAVYTKRCVACHGQNGEGNAKMAEMLKAEIKDLGAADVQAKSDEQLRKEVTEGVGKMKPVAGLADAELENLVAFLRTLKK